MKTLKKITIEHIRYRKTILKLAKADLIKTYKGTVLGWPWVLVRPIMTLGVYYFAFSIGLKVSSPVNDYSFFLWLIAGVVPWFYMRDILTAGASSIRKYKFLVTKIKYPISTIPTFVCVSNLIVNCILIILVMIVFILLGHSPDIYWIQIPFYILVMFVIFSIWSLFSGIVATVSNDFMQLVKSSVIIMFWMSGVMYDVNSINSEIIRNIMLINPITIIINGFRDAFIYKEWIWDSPNEFINLCVIFIIMLFLAVFCYKKLEHEIVDIL